MRAYRPASTQKTVHFATAPSTAVFRPAPLNTNSQRAAWIQENKSWSRTLAQTIEQRQQRQTEAEKEQDRAEHLLILHQQQEAQEKAQIEYDIQMADLSLNKCLWSMSCAGLAVSGVLLLILRTHLLRDTKGDRLGGNTTCDSVPRLTDGSIFSVVFWIAVYVNVDSRIVAPMAAANVAALSETLSPADAAYYRRQNESPVLVNAVGAALGTITLGLDMALRLCGKCDGGECLDIFLGTMAVTSLALLASILGTHILESGRSVMVGQWNRVSSAFSLKEEQREEVGKSGWALLSQDEKETFEWV